MSALIQGKGWVAMSGTRVKITSNPYSRNLSFMRWAGEWLPIDYSTAPTSGLLSEDIVKGFFPFNAKRIVELLEKEYGTSITIEFEGPGDEFADLGSVCSDRSIQLLQGERDLANAIDVLPSIIQVSKRAESLIQGTDIESESIDSDIKKIANVSKDQVPLCVIGNYSAGKSSFINALIGYEYLPSGTEALTAKVFRITKGDEPSHALISFGHEDQVQELWIEKSGLLREKSNGDDDFIELLLSKLEERPIALDLSAQVNRILKLINGSLSSEEIPILIPDLINLEVPFNPSDSWSECSNFVIFDTPGSNSKKNEEHGRVLREAMEGLSDGLLLFLAMPKTLDTIDNATLCNAAKKIDAMDDRFTMVIVNSADQILCPLEGFSAKHEQHVIDQAIPLELRPQGIYYVSSPVALGAKTGGSFVDEGTQWFFTSLRKRFSDPEDEQYTELFRCDILPPHIKQRSNSESEECDNRLLANSGLYCVEREIALFSQKYSAYNKCQQAEMLLRRIITSATSILQKEREQLEKELRRSEEDLARDKARLTEELGLCEREEEDRAVEGYVLEVLSKLDVDQWLITIKKLRAKESEFTQDSSAEYCLDDAADSARDARRTARDNLAARIEDAARSRSIDSLRDMFSGMVDDVGRVRDSRSKLGERQREVDRQAADLLLDYVRDSFSNAFELMASDVEIRSKRYWRHVAEETRSLLYETATGSTALSEEKRNEIGDIIIHFRDLELTTDAEELFSRSELEETLRLFNIVLIESERLNLYRVRDVYNKRMKAAFSDVLGTVRKSHTQSYFAWLDNLMADINGNITSFNPVLQQYVDLIREHTESVEKNMEVLAELDDCLQTVSQLISWRERG